MFCVRFVKGRNGAVSVNSTLKAFYAQEKGSRKVISNFKDGLKDFLRNYPTKFDTFDGGMIRIRVEKKNKKVFTPNRNLNGKATLHESIFNHLETYVKHECARRGQRGATVWDIDNEFTPHVEGDHPGVFSAFVEKNTLYGIYGFDFDGEFLTVNQKEVDEWRPRQESFEESIGMSKKQVSREQKKREVAESLREFISKRDRDGTGVDMGQISSFYSKYPAARAVMVKSGGARPFMREFKDLFRIQGQLVFAKHIKINSVKSYSRPTDSAQSSRAHTPFKLSSGSDRMVAEKLAEHIKTLMGQAMPTLPGNFNHFTSICPGARSAIGSVHGLSDFVERFPQLLAIQNGDVIAVGSTPKASKAKSTVTLIPNESSQRSVKAERREKAERMLERMKRQSSQESTSIVNDDEEVALAFKKFIEHQHDGALLASRLPEFFEQDTARVGFYKRIVKFSDRSQGGGEKKFFSSFPQHFVEQDGFYIIALDREEASRKLNEKVSQRRVFLEESEDESGRVFLEESEDRQRRVFLVESEDQSASASTLTRNATNISDGCASAQASAEFVRQNTKASTVALPDESDDDL